MKVFDLVEASDKAIFENKYPSGTLSATSEISPWRIYFKTLVETLFETPEDARLARLEDAEKVHKIINVILNKLDCK